MVDLGRPVAPLSIWKEEVEVASEYINTHNSSVQKGPESAVFLAAAL